MNISIFFRPSKVYRTMIIVLHITTLIVFILYYHGIVRWFLIILMSIGCFYAFYSDTRNWIEALEVRRDNRVFLKRKNSDYCMAKLEKMVFKSRYWMIVRWRLKHHVITRIITRDMCTTEEYHQLYIWLNWISL